MCFCVYNKKYRNMSAAGSDSDAETVITEGTIERGKGSTEKETVGKVSQLTVMSSLPSSATVPSPSDLFDRSFSARSSVGDSSPFRKFNISPPQLSIFNVEQFRVWDLAFQAHLHRFNLDQLLLPDASASEEVSASVAEIGQLIHHAVKQAALGPDFSASTLRSLLNLALLQRWSPSQLMDSMRRHLGLTSAHELETLETELFSLSPTAGEPLSTFLLRFSVLLAQFNSVAAHQNLPAISDRKVFHRLGRILSYWAGAGYLRNGSSLFRARVCVVRNCF